MSNNRGPIPQGHSVKANGLTMYYQEIGTGEPLILLHGGTATSDSWQGHYPLFAEHFRVIMPDWRGHGKTDNPTGEFSYALIADDLAAFIQALGLSKPLICGYSDGGQIILDFGMRYPELAGALGIGGAGYKFADRYFETLKSYGFEAPGDVRLDPEWAEGLKKDHARADDPDYWQTLVNQISYMWWRPLEYTDADLQKITAPTQVLLGDRDSFDVEQAVEMYRLIPNAELAIIPHADHGGAIGEIYGKIVLDFLLRQRAQSEQS